MGFRAISLPTMSNKYELIRSKETGCPICIFDNENQVRVCTFNSSNPAIETEAVKVLDGLSETATLHAQIARLQQREGELVGALKTIASYDEHSKHGEGICPYGCDTPHIARAALQSVAKEGEQ